MHVLHNFSGFNTNTTAFCLGRSSLSLLLLKSSMEQPFKLYLQLTQSISHTRLSFSLKHTHILFLQLAHTLQQSSLSLYQSHSPSITLSPFIERAQSRWFSFQFFTKQKKVYFSFLSSRPRRHAATRWTERAPFCGFSRKVSYLDRTSVKNHLRILYEFGTREKVQSSDSKFEIAE